MKWINQKRPHRENRLSRYFYSSELTISHFLIWLLLLFALPIRNVAFILFVAHKLHTDFAHDSTQLDTTRFDMAQFTNNLNVLRLHKLK